MWTYLAMLALLSQSVHGLKVPATACAGARSTAFNRLSVYGASRRAALLSTAALFSLSATERANAAVSACPKGANNCWSTASSDKTEMVPWKWPTDTSRDAALTMLRTTLEAYPQKGQDGVDLGGWSIADDQLSSSGYLRIEFKSGIGNFAKFFNGGKPFVDDLEVSVEGGLVAVRSSSRVGDSDFGVNAKRLNFISAMLREKGWDAPPITV